MTIGKSINRFLSTATGRTIEVESSDGLIRRGKLTEVRTRVVRANKDECVIPVELIFDDEHADPLPFNRLVRIDTISAK